MKEIFFGIKMRETFLLRLYFEGAIKMKKLIESVVENVITEFVKEEFGKIRAMELNNEPWFVGKDVAEALGYEDTDQALRKHIDEEDRLTRQIDGSGQKRNMTIINESGLYSLIFSSKLPAAKDFKRWVTSEVLPTIRKTGNYTIRYTPTLADEARLMEAKAKNAEVLMRIAENVPIDTYKQILYSKSAEIVTGEQCLPLPKVERKTYSATEIGEVLGISANKVGKISNEHHLKTPEYGQWFYDKARHSDKQVETWRYYDNVIDVMREYI